MRFSTSSFVNIQKQKDGQLDKANYAAWEDKNIYQLKFKNEGGLVMPIIIEWTFKDGSKEVDRIPVTIWRLNEKEVTKLFLKSKEVASIRLDPMRETADINEANGMWPIKEMPSRFQLFKKEGLGFSGPGAARSTGGAANAMQKSKQ